MKKLTIFFYIFIFLLPISFAETKIFSGKVITDTDKVIDSGIFRFTYDENSKKAFVQTPAGGLIVENGACKPNNIFRVCINMANFSHKNITTYVYYYEIDTTIYKLTGSLSTIGKVTSNTLLQGESTELAIAITNPTDFDITNIVFSYDLSPFYVSTAKGCELNDRLITWKGSLTQKYDKTCTATIFAEKEGKYNLAGNLSYFNGFESEKKTTDSVAVTVLPKQLKIIQFIEKNIEVNKPFYFNISLQNIHSSEDINEVTTIAIPSHTSLIKDTPSFEKSAKVLKLSSILKPGTSINFSLYMEKLSEGKEPINLKFAYTIKGISDVIENSTFIDIISIEPVNKSELKAEDKKSNETTSNLTATKEVQSSQAISENKTAEHFITDVQESKLSNKRILLLIIVALVAFTTLILVIFMVRKRRKESNKLVEKVVDKLDEEQLK